MWRSGNSKRSAPAAAAVRVGSFNSSINTGLQGDGGIADGARRQSHSYGTGGSRGEMDWSWPFIRLWLEKPRRLWYSRPGLEYSDGYDCCVCPSTMTSAKPSRTKSLRSDGLYGPFREPVSVSSQQICAGFLESSRRAVISRKNSLYERKVRWLIEDRMIPARPSSMVVPLSAAR